MQLTIEKLIYGGDGLARLPADEKGRGKTVLLPFVLEGERIEAAITQQRPGFARARPAQMLTASPHRIDPACPYFAQCGGCHYQHSNYEHQLQVKSAILRETLLRTAKLQLVEEICIHASSPWNYRNRARMRVAAASACFKLGYNRFASHELLAVEQCPISSPLINRAIAILWKLGCAGKVPAALSEIEFFANADDSQLLLACTMTSPGDGVAVLVEWVRQLRLALSPIVGVSVLNQAGDGSLTPQHLSPELQNVFGADHFVYLTARARYRVSAGSFFQSNRFLADELIDIVTLGQSGDCALDLYAGTGLFALLLSQNFREVIAVESATSSFHDLRRNCPSNVTTHRMTTERFLAEAANHAKFDLIVVDPPRCGLGGNTATALGLMKSPRIMYVSCDPSTLARDLRVLTQFGYCVKQAHLVDLFPQTFHIESVFELAR